MSLFLALLVMSPLLALSQTAGAADPWTQWTELRRPLHLPALAPGAPCPVSRPAPAGVHSAGRGIGPGPVYPIFGPDYGSGVLRFPYPPTARLFAGSGWGGWKVIWYDPSYGGPVLIRGGRIDAPGLVRFSRGAAGTVPPATELRWPPHGLPQYFDSNTRLRASGCYAYQIDGTSFSRVIVFRGLAVPPS